MNFSKYFIFLVILAGSIFSSFTQEKDSLENSKNAVFLEVLGGGGYYSIGYERTLLDTERFELSASIGITNLHFRKPKFSFGFPISLNNRLKFWDHHGVDFGLTLGNFINVWSIIDQDKYFNCPAGDCVSPLRLSPSFHAGWAFRLRRLYLSPRFYGFLYSSYNNRLKLEPFFGLRISYSF